jgi:hypothetical protein
VPGLGRWRYRAIRAREDSENVLFQRLSILWTLNTRSQLLGNDDAEVFERRENTVEVLERFVRAAVAKCLYQELSVEDVLPRCARHRSSGDAIAIPSIARVPSISSRWNTTSSSARSIVSVAVAAPSAFFAALSLERGNRYVLETRRSRADERFGVVVLRIYQVY